MISIKLMTGKKFTGKPKKIAEGRVFAFSGGPFNAPGWPASNIHTDLKLAQSIGLTTRAVSATQYQSHLVDMLIDIFGLDWFKYGRIDSKFIATVDVNDIITSNISVVSSEPEGSMVRFIMETWCENQHGRKVLVGSASCLTEKSQTEIKHG